MVSYALLILSLLVMRYISPDWYKPSFRVPLYPWLPLAGGLASLSVILTKDRFSQVAGLGIILLSLLFYFFWGRKYNDVQGEAQHLLDRLNARSEADLD